MGVRMRVRRMCLKSSDGFISKGGRRRLPRWKRMRVGNSHRAVRRRVRSSVAWHPGLRSIHPSIHPFLGAAENNTRYTTLDMLATSLAACFFGDLPGVVCAVRCVISLLDIDHGREYQSKLFLMGPRSNWGDEPLQCAFDCVLLACWGDGAFTIEHSLTLGRTTLASMQPNNYNVVRILNKSQR